MRARPAPLVQLGLLAAMAAAMQLAPLYMPGAGHLMAAAATLPVAVASALAPRRCTWFFLTTALVIGVISREEMLIFITTTGALGLTVGMLHDRPAWAAVAAGGALLAGGMVLLPALAGVYPFGGAERAWPPAVLAAGYLGFALAYTGLWRIFFVRFWGRLEAALRYTRVDRLS